MFLPSIPGVEHSTHPAVTGFGAVRQELDRLREEGWSYVAVLKTSPDAEPHAMVAAADSWTLVALDVEDYVKRGVFAMSQVDFLALSQCPGDTRPEWRYYTWISRDGKTIAK